ncbi:MAG: hypothetical protein ISS48_02980 [Candidatus Aenigmarchaeota archaeon]|nr:hypothetical protein [Candidatus Aenigmarchaeota archaeon]
MERIRRSYAGADLEEFEDIKPWPAWIERPEGLGKDIIPGFVDYDLVLSDSPVLTLYRPSCRHVDLPKGQLVITT